jgi:hypothetical protein
MRAPISHAIKNDTDRIDNERQPEFLMKKL